MQGVPASTHVGAEAYELALRGAGGHVVDSSDSDGAPLRVALYDAPPCDLAVPAINVPRLSINLRSAAVRGSLRGDPARDFGGRRYSLFVTPAQAEAQWRKQQRSRHINIYFAPDLLQEARDGRRPSCLQQAGFDLHRPLLRRWIDALELAMVRHDPFAGEACLSLARLIIATLGSEGERSRAVLSARELARVRDHVLAQLDTPLRVASLASTVGMTPSRFAIAFHAATGQSPHRFVIEQRLARAQELLRQSGEPLVDIAAHCGFSSQQHLTTTMRAVLGTTPGRMRRSGC